MGNIILIAAIGKNRELGKDNNLIWRIKEDLKFFKENTIGHTIVMGYNTYKSLPRLLPERKHVIITHSDINIDDVKVFHDFNELVVYLKSLEEDIYVIGGASIYEQFIPYSDELLLTEIDDKCPDADVYFPEWNSENYIREVISRNDGDISFSHVRYRRKICN